MLMAADEVDGAGKRQAAADELRDHLRRAAARHDQVVLDLTDVTFIDGTGLGAIGSPGMDAGYSRVIVLRRPGPLVLLVLRLTELDPAFPIEL